MAKSSEIRVEVISPAIVTSIIEASGGLLAQVAALPKKDIVFYAGRLLQDGGLYRVNLLGGDVRGTHFEINKSYLVTAKGLKEVHYYTDSDYEFFIKVNTDTIDYGSLFSQDANPFFDVQGTASLEKGRVTVELAQCKPQPNLTELVSYIKGNLQRIERGACRQFLGDPIKQVSFLLSGIGDIFSTVASIPPATTSSLPRIRKELLEILDEHKKDVFNIVKLSYDTRQKQWSGLEQLALFTVYRPLQ